MAYLGNTPASRVTSMDKQTITGDGGTDYTLDHAVGSEQEIEVFVNNVRQEPSVAYTVIGTALTMTGNVASTDDFYVVFQGKAQQSVTHPTNSALQATTGTFSGALSATDLTLSGGLYVGGTGSANYLDDYEEGTWTPTDDSGASLTFTIVETGKYVKIGNIVFVNMYITFPATASTAAIAIGGLPFTAGEGYFYLAGRAQGNATNDLVIQVNKETDLLSIHENDVQKANNAMTSKYLLFSGCYLT